MAQFLSQLITKHWQILFLILCLLFSFSSALLPYPLSWLVKILPIGLLIFVVYQNSSRLGNSFDLLLGFGLIFSLLGDFILEYYQQAGFIFGLAAFFIAHLFYIFRLRNYKFKPFHFLVTLTISGYAAYVCFLLYPSLGDLEIPVLAYMAVLLGMCLSTVYYFRSNIILILGGLSFVLSDSLLGINKFHNPIENSHIYIMVTYYFAQYCLVKGIITPLAK